MNERAEVIKVRLTSAVGGWDDFTVAELLRAMADETGPGEAWTELDLRRLANTFWPEG